MELEHRLIISVQEQWQQRNEGPNVSAPVLELKHLSAGEVRLYLLRDSLKLFVRGGDQ